MNSLGDNVAWFALYYVLVIIQLKISFEGALAGSLGYIECCYRLCESDGGYTVRPKTDRWYLVISYIIVGNL